MNDIPSHAERFRKNLPPLTPQQIAGEAVYHMDPLSFGVSEFTYAPRMIRLSERYGFTSEELAEQGNRTGPVSERKEIISRMREVDAELNDICDIIGEMIRREGNYAQAYVECRLSPDDQDAQDRWTSLHLGLGRFYSDAGLSTDTAKKMLHHIRQHGDAEISHQRGVFGRC